MAARGGGPNADRDSRTQGYTALMWAARQGHDAIELYHRRLLSLGVDEAELTAVATDIAAQVDAATDAAKAGRRVPARKGWQRHGQRAICPAQR